ncbi:MAG: hypothetical protein J6O18_01455, partial [Bacilli bacterium]|nr:hypothetical protein [Bacilli bacterium]
MKKKHVNLSNLARFSVEADKGLSSEQVAQRHNEGAVNVASGSIEKSNARIIAENAFTFFNCVLYVIALIFAAFMIYLNVSGHEAVRQEYFGMTK